ncbi:hypothetical protein [Paraflavitalea speifideaquila]|uniref:hypothetical protein n=1 Tax=Paraflavitalea speifideaquila TaxID=3076558 RepID=UPI0028E6DEC7|nr:hypothetical protein [Paraflavitalea speifideiaquila]
MKSINDSLINTLYPNFRISDTKLDLSDNGQTVLFNLEYNLPQSLNLSSSNDNVNVEIWHYEDLKIKPVLNKQKEFQNHFLAAINLQSNLLIKLESSEESFVAISELGNFAITNTNAFNTEPWLEGYKKKKYNVTSLTNGEKHFIKNDDRSDPFFTPDCKYVIFFYKQDGKYYSLSLTNYETKLISSNVTFFNEYYKYLIPSGHCPDIGVATFIKSTNSFLAYDNHDIWLLDPLGVSEPICVTNFFGRNNNIKLRLIETKIKPSVSEDIFVTSVNEQTKENGFYSFKINANSIPKLLYKCSCLIYTEESQFRRLLFT